MSSSAEASTSKAEPLQDGSATEPSANPPLHSQLTGVVGTLWRLANLQFNIWMMRTKIAVIRILIFAMLALIALVIAVIGIIFLYACVYHILTDVLLIPTVWALLIFAGTHLFIAGVFVFFAVRFLNGAKRRHKKSGDGV